MTDYSAAVERMGSVYLYFGLILEEISASIYLTNTSEESTGEAVLNSIFVSYDLNEKL